MSRFKIRKLRRNRRSLRLQALERRQLLAGDALHNYLDPYDVNDDAIVTASDALTIVNEMSREEAGSHDASSDTPDGHHSYWDVNDDGHATASDVLQVIQEMERTAQNQSSGQLVAFVSGPNGERGKLELEPQGAGFKLEIKVQYAPVNSALDVFIDGQLVTQIHTDAMGRGKFETGEHGQVPAVDLSQVSAGSTVAIDQIGMGTFVADDDQGDGDDDHHDQNDDHHSDSHSDDGINDDSHAHDGTSGSTDDSGHHDAPPTAATGTTSVGATDSDSSPSDAHSSDSSSHSGSGSHSDGSSHSDSGSHSDSSSHSDSGSHSDAHSDDHVTNPSTSPVAPAVGSQELKARLDGSGFGEAEFEMKPGKMEFKVEVSHMAANQTFSVSINDVAVGQLRTDSQGKGKLKFESNHAGMEFPAGFPQIVAGNTIKVGNNLMGTFAVKPSGHDGGDDHHSGHDDHGSDGDHHGKHDD